VQSKEKVVGDDSDTYFIIPGLKREGVLDTSSKGGSKIEEEIGL